MATNPLNTSARVILDASGNGTVKLGPSVRGQILHVMVASVSTSTAVLIPQCSIFIGATATPDNFVDGTYTGNLNSTDRTAALPITAGNYLFAAWTGGDVGAVATLSVIGTVDSP